MSKTQLYGKERALTLGLLTAKGGNSIRWGLAITLGTALMGLAGCTGDNDPKGLIDPTQTGRWKHDPLVVRILDHLDAGVEEPTEEFVNYTDIRQDDLVATTTDYTVGPADLLQVSISDLVGPGVDTVRTIRVTESGNVPLPLLDKPVKVTGLTEQQSQEAIQRAYREAGIIQRAQVSVQVLEQRNRTFSIMGAVQAPGQYAILPADMRLMQALVQARGLQIPDLREMYVIRKDQSHRPGAEGAAPPTRPSSGPGSDILEPRPTETAPPGGTTPGSGGGATPLEPRSDATRAAAQKVALLQTGGAGAAGQTSGEAGSYIIVDGKPVLVGGSNAAGGANVKTSTDGAAATATAGATSDRAPGGRFEFNDLASPENARIIRIPLDKLQKGDLKYNIVIKPDDILIVPNPTVGEYYMGGHVGRPGVYSLTNRQITLKQAVVSAGMYDPLAIPERTEIIRRTATNQEVFVRVDLEKVWAGEQPDVFLKPNDVVNVGTTWWASFLTAARGAFRMTYGFGFLYDRNFYDEQLFSETGQTSSRSSIAPVATP